MTFGIGSSARYRLFGDHEVGLGNLGRGTGSDCLRSLLRVGDRLRRRRRSLVVVDLLDVFFLLFFFFFFVLALLLTVLRLKFVV